MVKTVPPNLKLVDILALDRTRLANERTLLAYWRSGFALLIAGISLIKVFHQDTRLMVLGSVFIAMFPVIISIGAYRSYRFQKRWKTYFEYSPEDLSHV